MMMVRVHGFHIFVLNTFFQFEAFSPFGQGKPVVVVAVTFIQERSNTVFHGDEWSADFHQFLAWNMTEKHFVFRVKKIKHAIWVFFLVILKLLLTGRSGLCPGRKISTKSDVAEVAL